MSNRLLHRELAVIPHPVTIIGGKRKAGVSFIGTVTNASASATQTFLAAAVGAAVLGRLVIVGVHWRNNATPRTISSATIGGSAATVFQANQTIGENSGAALVYLTVASGSALDIVINYSGSVEFTTIAVHRAVNLTSPTPTQTNFGLSNSSSTFSTTVNVNTGGIVVSLCTNDVQTTSITYIAGAISRYDINATLVRVGGANQENLLAQTPRTVTINSASNAQVLMAGSWS